MMWYCFVREDLDLLSDDDPLMIQSMYAKDIRAFCMIDLSAGVILDRDNTVMDLSGKRVLVRGTCDSLPTALMLLQQRNCHLLETEADIMKILHWELLQQAKRKIISLKVGYLLSGYLSDAARAMLEEHACVFIKSREKGFTARVSSGRLLNRDPAVMAVIQKHCPPDAEILVSELMNIKCDSLGKKESRHFVMDNRIQNSSRPIHSLVHSVPKTLLCEADKIVKQIAEIEGFPDNYVLDLGLVEKNGETIVDIIEINPIGSAMCYVNNSIFPGVPHEDSTVSYGREYQLDMIRNPLRYRAKRFSGEKFDYCSVEQYEFL